jgi:hypothetical protein
MWKGDQVAACVAAASVIAKVTRDALMCDLDKVYPHYGFARHKGYSTRSHMRALDEHGPCPEHRMSFVNVRGRIPAEPGTSPDDLLGVGLAELEPGLGELESALGELEPGLGDVGPGLGELEPGLGDVGPGSAGQQRSPAKSATANSCCPSGTGQNGPIVDIIEEQGRPTAGLAAMARGA